MDGTRIVAINGKSVSGTRLVIAPGVNTVRTRFRWPQGGTGEADLKFYATPNTVYYVYYSVHPPYRGNDNLGDKMLMGLSDTGSQDAILGAVAVGPVAAAVGAADKVVHETSQNLNPGKHIDVMVVAPRSGQGIVRQVRAYPDGRVDAKTWAPWAQLKAP